MSSKGIIIAHYDIEDAIEHLYDVTIFEKLILTTVTRYPDAVDEWINNLYSEDTVHRYIGFEVEFTAANDLIATVQFCVGHCCLIIQLLHMAYYPPSLDFFLSDSSHTFVAVDAELKIKMLTEQCSTIEGPVMYGDLAVLSAEIFHRPELRDEALGELFTVALGLEIVMPDVEIAHWARRDRLSEAQVKYACLHAYASFELGRRLTS